MKSETSNRGLRLYWDEMIREQKEVSSSHFVPLIYIFINSFIRIYSLYEIVESREHTYKWKSRPIK